MYEHPDDRDRKLLYRILEQLERLTKKVSEMATSQAEFTPVLETYIASVGAYTKAVEAALAAIAAIPAVDLTPELNAVTAASAELATAQAALPQPPAQ